MKTQIIKGSNICSIFFLMASIMYSVLSWGQQNKTQDKLIASNVNKNMETEWVYFNPGLKMGAEELFEKQKANFRLGSDDKMIIKRKETDEIGYTHTKFYQYYRGVRVECAEYVVHEKNGIIEKANGILIRNINVDVTPQLSESQALSSALNYINAEEYLWQNANAEDLLKKQNKDVKASYYPKGELVITGSTFFNSFVAADLHLCWAFDINCLKPTEAYRVFVDAKTGKTLRTQPLSSSCSPGSGFTVWHGVVNINTYWDGTNYNLFNDCTSTLYSVWDHQGGGTPIPYTDADNNWNTLNSYQDGGVETMWAVGKILDYYSLKHNRNSWNGTGGAVFAFNNSLISGSSNNSCWHCEGNVITLGGGNSSSSNDDWNTIDVVGHEFTHGVVQETAGLKYLYESGALNESFADIFGTCIERFAEADLNFMTPDWTLNEDRGDTIRDFTNPNRFRDPDTYYGNFYKLDTADNGGVHTNSGVQNYWFYLLSVGGTGRNDNNDPFQVSGIGIEKAAKIAYRNLTCYLNPFATFAASREGSIQAAIDLYGACSNEAIQTAEAWYAVGVGMSESYYNNAASGTFSGTYDAVNTLNVENGTVYSGYSATFQAAKKVSVKPPFNANSGSSTEFKINPCSVTMENLPPHP